MQPTEPTDAELVAQTLAGNREAFGDLYDRYARLVRSVVCGVTWDWPMVQDLTQESFLRAYRKLGSLREPAVRGLGGGHRAASGPRSAGEACAVIGTCSWASGRWRSSRAAGRLKSRPPRNGNSCDGKWRRSANGNNWRFTRFFSRGAMRHGRPNS